MTRPFHQEHHSFWKYSPKVVCAFGLLMILLVAASPVIAQDEKKKDDTGTNPVNFTYDFRFITEMQQFKDDGGSQTKNILEWRAPLGKDIKNVGGGGIFNDMGKTFGLRFRAYHNSLSLNNSTSPTADFGTNEVSGIGDFDARILAIAYSSKKFVLAPGLEAFFNTASNDALGSGKNTLAPVVFGVFLGAFGPGSLFAPGYQYVFDVGGDSAAGAISRSQIDLYFVWVLTKGMNWFLLDPQIILDHENDAEFMTVDAEWGFMIAPKQGISGYVRPGVGFGSDRPFDYNLEFALKFIWR